MLQSAVWNSQYLKKILRIPEDQLKILNNIPGWTSEVDSAQNSHSIKTSSSKGEENQQTPSISVVPTSTVSQKALVVDCKESEKRSEDTNRKDRFSLRKSSSLDSVSIHKTDSSLLVKRSSSTSDIKEKAAAVQTFSFSTHNFSSGNKAISREKILSKIEVEEMEVEINHRSCEKSQFSNSGVQCKMSQDLNLELDEVGNESKLLNALSLVRKSKKDCFDDAGISSGENLALKSKIDADESYISQSVPCAQPIRENLHLEKKLATNQEECTSSQNKNFSSFSKNVESPSDKTNLNLSGKRKRKSRSEKSKKYRGVNAEHIKIEYSLEQVKKMMELVKVLHKY